MTPDAIQALSDELTLYVLQLHRAPTAREIEIFITKFLRARKNGRLMI